MKLLLVELSRISRFNLDVCRLDLNGDGVILEDELAAVLKKIMPETCPKWGPTRNHMRHHV